jgi:hypothetical protein
MLPGTQNDTTNQNLPSTKHHSTPQNKPAQRSSIKTHRTTAKRRTAKERRQMRPSTANFTTVGMPERSCFDVFCVCGGGLRWWVWDTGGPTWIRMIIQPAPPNTPTHHPTTAAPHHPTTPPLNPHVIYPIHPIHPQTTTRTHPVALDARVPTAQPAGGGHRSRLAPAAAAAAASEEIKDPAAAPRGLLFLLVVRLGRHGRSLSVCRSG